MEKITNPGSTPFEQGATSATLPTGNSKADLFLAQAAIDAVNDENKKSAAAAVAPPVLKAVAPPPPQPARPVERPAATVIDTKEEATPSLSSKVLAGARKTAKATLYVAGKTAQVACVAATLGLGASAASGVTQADFSHVYDIGVREAFANYREHGSVYEPDQSSEVAYYYVQEIATRGLALAALAAARYPEPAKQTLLSAWETAKAPVSTYEAAKARVSNFFVGK